MLETPLQLLPLGETGVDTLGRLFDEREEPAGGRLPIPSPSQPVADWKAQEASRPRQRLFVVADVSHIPHLAVGTVALERIGGAAAEISYWIHPKFRRRGFGLGALSAVLDLGRRELGLRLFTAWVAEDNQASRGLLERAGFRARPGTEVQGAGAGALRRYQWGIASSSVSIR